MTKPCQSSVIQDKTLEFEYSHIIADNDLKTPQVWTDSVTNVLDVAPF